MTRVIAVPIWSVFTVGLVSSIVWAISSTVALVTPWFDPRFVESLHLSSQADSLSIPVFYGVGEGLFMLWMSALIAIILIIVIKNTHQKHLILLNLWPHPSNTYLVVIRVMVLLGIVCNIAQALAQYYFVNGLVIWMAMIGQLAWLVTTLIVLWILSTPDTKKT